jgi:hypothetical protein
LNNENQNTTNYNTNGIDITTPPQYYQHPPTSNLVQVNDPKLGRHFHIGTLLVNIGSWFCNVLFVVGLIGTIIAGALNMKPTWMFPTFLPITILAFMGRFVLFFAQMVSCRYSTTAGFLSNSHDGIDFFEYIKRIKSYPLKLGFVCTCFHFETRTRHVTTTVNGKTTTRLETYTVRVNTFNETELFPYKTCVDKSDDVDARQFSSPMVQVQMSKDFQFGDPKTEHFFNYARSEFIKRNQFRDTHFEEAILWDIDEYKTEVMYMDQTRKPALYNIHIWRLLSLLSCNWPFMIWVDAISAHTSFKVRKIIV